MSWIVAPVIAPEEPLSIFIPALAALFGPTL
jgi:hypothetical protein